MLLPGWLLLDIHPIKFLHQLPISLEKFKSINIDNNNNGDIIIEEFQKIYLKKIPNSHSNLEAEDLLDDYNYGPESIAIDFAKTKNLITGSKDSTLYLIEQNLNKTIPLLQILTEEDFRKYPERSKVCLGLKFDSLGNLFAILPEWGLFKIENIFDPNSRKISQLFDVKQTESIPGSTGQSKFLDDLTIEEHSNGLHKIYITDVSTKFKQSESIINILGSDKTGRILLFDMQTNQLEILVENLLFPNGIEMLWDNSGFLFSEFVTRTIWKYTFLEKNLEIFLNELPSEVDNIRKNYNNGNGNDKTYWLAMFEPRTFQQPIELDYYLKKPLLRKLLLRSINLMGIILDFFNKYFLQNLLIYKNHQQDFYNNNLNNFIENLKSLNFLTKYLFPINGAMLMELNENGLVLNSFYSKKLFNELEDLNENGNKNEDLIKLNFLSEICEIKSNNKNEKNGKRILYLGSYYLPYIRKIILRTN